MASAPVSVSLISLLAACPHHMTCPLSTTQQALTMHLWLAWNTCLWLPSTGIKDLGSRSCTSPGAMTTRVLAPPSGLCEKPGTSTRLCVTCRKGGSGGNRWGDAAHPAPGRPGTPAGLFQGAGKLGLAEVRSSGAA